MSEKTDYVMLPPKNGSGGRKPLTRYLIFGFLLVAVAAASWWIGQLSKTQNADKNAEIKQVPPSQESESDSQLAGASGNSGGDDGGSAAAETPGSSGNSTSKPDPASLAKGGVTISTTPPEADAEVQIVNMDYENVRSSSAIPASLTELPVGFYDMKISADGYKTHEGTFEVVANKVRELAPIELVRELGKLEVKTNHPAEWKLHTFHTDPEAENKVVASGKTPALIEDLPTAAYRLTLNREGWPLTGRSVTIHADKTTEFSHEFHEGGINVKSEPEGVAIWLKRPGDPVAERVGETPMNLKSLPEGEYEVELRHTEGDPKKTVVKVQADKVGEVYGSWLKLPVQITSDPPGATIFYGGNRLIGDGNFMQTPLTARLLEGEHELLATMPGLEDVKLTINVSGSQNNNTAEFKFQYGSVKITSEPSGAEVFVGEQLLGVTPMAAPRLKPGEYEFLIRKERFAERKIPDTIRAGARNDINAKLNYDPMPVAGRDFTNGAGQRMKWIPRLKGWAETTETAQISFQMVMGNNPSEIRGDRVPVNNVSWNEATKYCEKLTLNDRGQGLIPPGYSYRLPTDAEWTLLAAGTTLEQSVTSRGQARDTIATVASLEANPQGLHDTRGNVWEWCHDWYTRETADREQAENASGKPAQIGTRFKILRGGSWNRSLESNLSIGYRLLADPGNHKNYETGFRVVLMPGEN